MVRFLTLVTLLSVIACLAVGSSIAEVTNTPPADINAAASNAAGARQAPAEVMNKLADLVHAGKYGEAQQLTTGLLAAYPDDERLIKAKALLAKLAASAGSPNATASSDQPTKRVASGQPAANTTAEQLTGMERVDYDALLDLGRQAQQTSDPAQQTKALQQFMDQSGVFLQKHPAEIPLWQLRAASAMVLNDPMAGYEAGQRLIVADSNDPNVRRLLAQLKNRGWLDKQGAEEAKEQADEEQKAKPKEIVVVFTGDTWHKEAAYPENGIAPLDLEGNVEPAVIALVQSRFPHSTVLINSVDVGRAALRVTLNMHDTIWRQHNTFSGTAFSVESQLLISVSSPTGLHVDRPFSLHIEHHVKLNDGSNFGTHLFRLTKLNWLKHEVLVKVRSMLDEELVRTSLGSPAPNP